MDCAVLRTIFGDLAVRCQQCSLMHTTILHKISREMLKRTAVQVQRENRHLEAQLETMREQHHLVAQLLAARLKQQDETDSKGVQDT